MINYRNMLGAELPITSKKIAKCSFILAIIIACMNSLFLIFSKRSLGYLFTSDKRVVELVEQVLPLAAMFQFSDGLACVGAGILRGCGRQKLGAIANLGGYYIFGLPLGIIFAFVLDLKLLGLWYGITIGIVIVSIFDLVYILKLIDWNAEVTRALKLVRTNRSTFAEESPLLTNME
jgi:multidrug resistance protein, MATE family